MTDLDRLNRLKTKIENGLALSPHEEKQFAKLQEDLGLTERGTIKTKTALADALGVTRKTIHQWIREDGMPVEEDGTFCPDRILEWRGAKKSDGASGESDVEQKSYWEVRFRRARALGAEIVLKRDAGTLIARSEVEALLVERAVEFKKALLGRGRRLSLRLANKDSQEIQRILDEDSMSILETYSRQNSVTGTTTEAPTKRLAARQKKKAAPPKRKKARGRSSAGHD